MRSLLATVAVLLFPLAAVAQVVASLDQLGEVDLKGAGLEVSARDLVNPDRPALASAVVDLGFASGVFLSPGGLVLTSYDPLVAAIGGDPSWLQEGFHARVPEAEIPLPGVTARVLLQMRDVTADLGQAAAEGGEDSQPSAARMEQLVTAARKGYPDLEAEVAESADGRTFHLFLYQRVTDLRLVYAPPLALAGPAGEPDRLSWPRLVGGFVFLRAWADPDGHARAYNAENTAYQPPNGVRLMARHLRAGQVVACLGYSATPKGRSPRLSTGRLADASDQGRPFVTLGDLLAQSATGVSCSLPAELEGLELRGELGRWREPVLGDVPVAFLSGCDRDVATAGSPVFNAWGELVGVVAGPATGSPANGAAAVDIRYVLLTLEKVSVAEKLLKELRVAPDADLLPPAPWLIVWLRPAGDQRPNGGDLERLRSGHLEYVRRLRAEGRLVVTGELDDGSWFLILRVGSAGQLGPLLQDDPLVRDAHLVASGAAVQLTVGSFCAAAPGGDMVGLQLALFNRDRAVVVAGGPWAPAPFRPTVGELAQVVAAGSLGYGHAGFVVEDAGSVAEAERLLASLPGGIDPQWSHEVHSLRVERGSFCARQP